jgi:hypothetical protein
MSNNAKAHNSQAPSTDTSDQLSKALHGAYRARALTRMLEEFTHISASHKIDEPFPLSIADLSLVAEVIEAELSTVVSHLEDLEGTGNA